MEALHAIRVLWEKELQVAKEVKALCSSIEYQEAMVEFVVETYL